MKYFILFMALLAVWLFFSDHGRQFYQDKFAVKPVEITVSIPPQVNHKITQLEAQILEKDAKIKQLQNEVTSETMLRSNGVSGAFRTDLHFLERSIKRIESEKAQLQEQLDQLKRQYAAPAQLPPVR